MAPHRCVDPRISVVIPAYNVGRYIGAAVESALAQTRPAHEVIVVDDGSTDSTGAVLRRYDDRIRVIRQRNAGVGAARNRGAREASGDHFVFLDGDDVLLPEALARQVAVLERYPASGLVAGDGTKFDGDAVIAKTLLHVPFAPMNPHNVDEGVVHGRFYVESIRYNPLTSPGQALVPREVFDAVGGFTEARWFSEDWDMWLRIARSHPLTLHTAPVLRYRHHQDSSSGADDERAIRWLIWCIPVALSHLAESPPEAVGALEDRLANAISEGSNEAYYYGRRGHRRRAFGYLFRIWRAAPWSMIPASRIVALALPERPLAALLGGLRRARARLPRRHA